ncbi:Gamma-tubulin complex component 2 homolog [Gryllus bimaculatus]|nr:Gamma-tubulin complex component 2 homolog [Gryllus bimaculatus]
MSVFELVSELCLKVFDSEFNKNDWYPDLPKIRRKALKKLRSKCYEILLHKVSIPNSNYEDDWSPAAQVIGHVFTLQQQGLFRDAKKMMMYAHKMVDSNLHCNPVVIAVLELLLRLQDSVERQEDYEPILFRYEEPKPYDPSQGPMPYDILHPSAFEPQPWMLHLERQGSSGYFPAAGSFPFTSEPGQDLPVLGRFLQPARMDGRGSTVPLYAIPQFPVLTEPRGLQIPSISLESGALRGRRRFQKAAADEGYATPSLKGSCAASPSARSPDELLLAADGVWRAALAYRPPALRTWETLGSRVPDKERPFLSEAGQEAAQHFIEIVRQWPLLQPGRRPVIAPHVLSVEQLTRDIGYLLQGVQSHTFLFSEVTFAFSLAPGVCVQDLSPLAMSNYCRELLELGTCARRLQLLTERGVPGHPRTRLMEALREHVKMYLQFHWGAALLMPQGTSLLALQYWAQGLHQKTVAMAQLCGVAPPSDSWKGPRKLPSGIALVSYIYETLSRETRPDVCCILYSALRGVSQVYFRFLEQWIFGGTLFDTWEEFFVQAVGSADLLASRNRKYWAHVFHIVKGAVPGFLRGLEDDILLCGKTVHLLKLCCPKAALCVALESGHPPVPCCLQGRELRQLSSKCRLFERRVRELERAGSSRGSDSGIETMTIWRRHGPTEGELMERQEVIRQALEQEARRQAVVQKQRQWRAELQQQVQETQERREEEQRFEREQELRVLEVNRQRQLEDEQRKEEEKQRMIEHYEELSLVAMKRKQLADWRLERLNLRDRREEFILNDRREWRAAAAELNLKNIERSIAGSPLTIIEEDSDAAKHETPSENHAPLLNLPLVTTTIDNDATGVGIDNATMNQGSPNNNNVDNVTDRGDINENLNGLALNIRESRFTNANSNLLGSSIEDAALGNALIPLGNRNENITSGNAAGGFDNFTAAATIKAKVQDQEFGICPQRRKDDTKDKGSVVGERVLSAAERNRLKVMEQEFGITQPRRERPKSVPFKSSIRDSVSDRDSYSQAQETVRQNFQDTVAQRRTNHWNMLHGGLNIITGVMNMFPVQTVPETEQLQVTEVDSMSMKDTPSDDGVQVVLQSPASVDAPMSKSESSGSVNHVYKSASGLSSKTSSSYNITSIASSVSFDMGSGKFSLNTPTSTDDGSVDTFKTCAGTGGGYSSESSERHRDLANPGIAYWRSHRLTKDEGDCGTAEDLQSEHSGDEEEVSSDTSDAVDYTDFTSVNVALQKSVAIPLHMQLRLANEAVLKYFFQDLNLYGHFRSMRSFFFLMDGEYRHTVTNSLFKKMTTVRQPSHLLNYVVLNDVLQMALDTSSSGGEENAKRISFKVSSTPDHFQLTSTGVLECLSLHYRTEWPLNILLTEECLLKYNIIFTFHLKYRTVQLWRHEMTHFVSSFQNYIMGTAVQSCWVNFEQELNQVQTLDNLYLKHAGYVKSILFRCLLYNKCRPIHNLMMQAFDTILKFIAQLEASQWHQCGEDQTTLEHPDFRTLSLIHDSFRFYTGCTYKSLEKMIRKGYQPQFKELLEMLNANGYYTDLESG